MSLQIAAALSSLCEPFLPLHEIIKNFKIESPLSWSYFKTSDLIVAGHQIGEADCFLQN
jgi:methionyl-tRNA synthetase